MEKQNYDFFLFTKLIQANRIISEDLEYDLQFEDLEGLYWEYVNSKFNVSSKGAYDCMLNFIGYKQYQMDAYYTQEFDKKVNELLDLASKITNKYKKA